MRLRLPPVPVVLDRVPPLDAILAHPWELLSGTPEKDWAWDYSVDLTYIRHVEIDPARLASALKLPAQTEVRLVAEWTSDLSPLLRGTSFIHQFRLDNEPQQFDLRADLRGEEVGGRIKLSTVLALASDEIAPRGTILWSDFEQVDLERHTPSIPVSVVHFSEFPGRFADANAAWSIEIAGGGYQSSVSGGLQIFLNGDFEDFVERVTSDEDDLAKSWFAFEVARHLTQRVVLDDVFWFDEAYEPGTLGDSLQSMVRAYFPGRTRGELRSLIETSPQDFDALVQSKVLWGT